MSRRAVFWLGVLTMLAIVALIARPIAAQALGVHPAPQDLKIVGLPNGGHLCVDTSSCDTMTPASNGMTLQPEPTLLVLSGLVFTIVLLRLRALVSLAVQVSSPPPRLPAA